jgi:sulfur carrier protein
VVAASSRFGKIGIKPSAEHDDFICRGDLSPPVVVSQRMKIFLNGEPVDAREAKTIAELVGCYELPPQSILVEHNGLALHRYEWAERSLSEGDRIEFVRVVAGG